MLKSLSIRNFVLIDRLDVEFDSGFSVITGETGTGKSVLLGAVSMLLGQRSDTKSVREGSDKCIIEGTFDLSSFSLHTFFDDNELEYDEKDCIIRRELSATGRSRAFINDTPVSISLLKELGARLIDIHSQHQNLLLGDKNYQLNVLDILAGSADALFDYRSLYNTYIAEQRRLIELEAELEKSRQDEEWLRFQLNEIEQGAFKHGEQEELEEELQELTHAEEIQAALFGASTAIDGDDERNMLQALREAVNSLARISKHYASAGDLSERIESNYIELKDICNELRTRMERVTFSPDRLQYVDARLTLIYDLQKKHRLASLDELLALADDYKKRLEHITNGDEEIIRAKQRCTVLRDNLAKKASSLTLLRKKAAEELQKRIVDILVTLGMPLIRFEVAFAVASDFTLTGVDIVTFLFSSNSISPMQPLADVASGGEMARVMLALKSLVADCTDQPTLIFDEIDTGISGVLAERMGCLMQQMGSANRQVISITHLPQVAALGNEHYKVYKEETSLGTRTNIVKLEGEARVREIAQMVSGELLSDAAIDNARTLLSKSKN